MKPDFGPRFTFKVSDRVRFIGPGVDEPGTVAGTALVQGIFKFYRVNLDNGTCAFCRECELFALIEPEIEDTLPCEVEA